MSNQGQKLLVPIAVGAFGFIVKYVACNFLTPVVFMTLAALVFAQLVIVGPEIPFYEYVSGLIPDRIEVENIRLDETDIMKAYNLITLAFFVISVVGRWLVRLLVRAYQQVFQPDLDMTMGPEKVPASPGLLSTLKRRLLINSIAITVAYLIAFLAIPSATMSDGSSLTSMYLVFGVFYIIAMISNAIYVGIDSLSDRVIGWAMTNGPMYVHS